MQHVEARQEEVEELNDELTARVGELNSVLRSYVDGANGPVDFEALKSPYDPPEFDPQGADKPSPPPKLEALMPSKLGFLANIVPGAKDKHVAAVAAAEKLYAEQIKVHAAGEAERAMWLSDAHDQYEAACRRLRDEREQQNSEVEAFRKDYEAGKPDAVIHYFSIVLEQDVLPSEFPQLTRVGYLPESKQLVVERQLPTVEVIPAEASYKYVRSSDQIAPTARSATQARALYGSIIAQTALRTLALILRATTTDAVQSVALNCFVDTISPATGQRVTPCLLTARVNLDTLRGLNLAAVDPVACLRTLNAQVSRSPHELAAVKPIVDFNMVDPRFIDKTDVLSSLDQRPNLADLSPSEFEALMTNLFEKMGLETRLTQASRDGGVDCVAWDLRPIIGGKVVIQAKRYKHTVGVSAVRDLYGTLMNEGAAKGILVSTSGYGKSAYQFSENKPLELITGSNLLYLLEERCDIQAKIDFPDDWVDPVADAEELSVGPHL